MQIRPIYKFKNPSSDVVMFYSTKNRLHFTNLTSPILLDDKNIDLIWLDGSTENDSKDLAFSKMNNSLSACELHMNITGGPDIAIMYALTLFLKSKHEYMVLIENDIQLHPGWLEATLDSMNEARSDGYTVGGSTARVISNRVLKRCKKYNLLFGAGAACISLTKNAAFILLKNYRTFYGDEVKNFFENIFTISLPLKFESNFLSVDWGFEYILYNHNLVITSPKKTYANNIDCDIKYDCSKSIYRDNAIDNDKKIQLPLTVDKILIRGQKSPVSKELFIPLQHLKFDQEVGSVIKFLGEWKLKWVQGMGPFEKRGGIECVLFHKGSITILINIVEVGTIIKVQTELNITEHSFKNTGYYELNILCLEDSPKNSKINIEKGEIGVVGILSNTDFIYEYLNEIPNISSLLPDMIMQ